jgi:hypothetical protein
MAEEGVVVVGVPVGSAAFREAFVVGRLGAFGAVLGDLLRVLDPQRAAVLLARCVSQRPSFLSRTVDPFLVHGRWEGWDSRMEATFGDLLGHGVGFLLAGDVAHRAARRQLFLPTRLGGFGVRSTARYAVLSFAASWVQCAPVLAAQFPVVAAAFAAGDLSQVCPCLGRAREGLAALVELPSWEEAPRALPQRWFTRAARRAEAQELELVRAEWREWGERGEVPGEPAPTRAGWVEGAGGAAAVDAAG